MIENSVFNYRYFVRIDINFERIYVRMKRYIIIY